MAANDKGGTTGEPKAAGPAQDNEERERLAALYKASWESVVPRKSDPGDAAAPAATAARKSPIPRPRIRQVTLQGVAPMAASADSVETAASKKLESMPVPEGGGSKAMTQQVAPTDKTQESPDAPKGPEAALPAQHADYTPPTPVAAKQTAEVDAPPNSVEVRDAPSRDEPSQDAASEDATEAAPSELDGESSSKVPTVPPKGRGAGRQGAVQLTARDLILIAVAVIALAPIFIVGMRVLLTPAPPRVVYQTVGTLPPATATVSPRQEVKTQAATATPPVQEAPSAAPVDVTTLPEPAEEDDVIKTAEPIRPATRTLMTDAQPKAQSPTLINSKREPKTSVVKRQPAATAEPPKRASTPAPGGASIVRDSPF